MEEDGLGKGRVQERVWDRQGGGGGRVVRQLVWPRAQMAVVVVDVAKIAVKCTST